MLYYYRILYMGKMDNKLDLSKIEEYYDNSGTASHYDNHRVNCFHQQEAIWGTYNLMLHYEMQIFEYKFRLGKKDNAEQELLKIHWLETMILYLRNKILRGEAIQGYTEMKHPLPNEFTKMLSEG